MKYIKNKILMLFVAILLAGSISCSQTVVPSSTESLKPSTITITTTKTEYITQTLTVLPTSVPTTTTTTSIEPTITPTQTPTYNNTFYTAKIISGYDKTYRPDGTIQQTPIYKDLFFDLNIIGYYTSKDAIYVPRIPTFTTHDDWFIRPQFSGSFLKSWIFNWGYTVDTSIKSSDPVELTFTIYNKEIFDNDYYLKPADLIFHDLKGDVEPSTSGILSKRLVYEDTHIIYPKEYVFLIRTNNAAAISDWWIKVGTESPIK